jgi:hypothetical protein
MTKVINDYMDIELYPADDPTNKMGIFSQFLEPQFLSDLGNGGGSFKVNRVNNKLVNNPEWFASRVIAKCRIDGTIVGAFVIDQKAPSFIQVGETKAETFTFAGVGLKGAWLPDAILYPSVGLQSGINTNRVFNFASEKGDWYDSTKWVAPTKIQAQTSTINTGTWSTYPSEWPTSTGAWWVWGTYNTDTNYAAEGINYFRSELIVTEAEGEGDYTIYASGNDEFQVFVDGGILIQSEGINPDTKTWRSDFHLSVGKHVIAARVLNTAGKAGFIASVFKAGATAEAAGTLLNYTGDGISWLVNAYPDKAPGWSVGEILIKLLSEAQDRGVWFAHWVIPTFTSTTDSNGDAWPDSLDWSWELGTNYLAILESIEEVGFEAWIDPDLYTFNIVPSRGQDYSIKGSPSAKTFERGKNLLSASQQNVSAIKNMLLVKSNEGWFEAEDNMAYSQALYGRIEGYLSINNGLRVSQLTADVILSQKNTPEISATYEIVPIAGSTPFKDIHEGDWVLAPDDTDTLVPRRIVSLAAGVEASTGRVIYTAEFDTMFQDTNDRLAQWLARVDKGSLGGIVKNANRGQTLQIADRFTETSPKQTILGIPASITSLQGVLPSSVDLGSGTASVASDGLILFNGCSSVSLNNIFNGLGGDTYDVFINSVGSVANYQFLRLRQGGLNISGTSYNRVGETTQLAAGPTRSTATGTSEFSYLFPFTTAIPNISARITVFTPMKTGSIAQCLTEALSAASDRFKWSEYGQGSGGCDGLSLIALAGTMSGTMKVVKVS